MWKSVDHRYLVFPADEASASKEVVSLPVMTEVVFPVTNEENDRTSYIVCYSRAVVEMTPVKLKFVGCIATAAVIASTNFHDYAADDAELDALSVTDYTGKLMEGTDDELLEGDQPPSWEPMDTHNYDVRMIPAALKVPNNIRFDEITDINYIADGSNSNVYSGKYNGQSVVVKIISDAAKNSKVALHEFNVEHGMLARMNHPNIVKVIGAGHDPRRFIVLEHLVGGSLAEVLNINEQGAVAKKLFKKNTFDWPTLLQMAKDISDAFAYLHCGMHPESTLIHRDLKPDNVGFTEDGTVKLFDFGLCTLVKRMETVDGTYDMTGHTGSLRYMAGEVALRMPYNEKVDVYSYGILLWQMAKDKVPFKGMNKSDFMNQVVRKGVRPKIDKTWPKDFVDLLESCWHADFKRRPSFEMVSHALTRQLLQEKPKMNRRASFTKIKSQNQSTWF